MTAACALLTMVLGCGFKCFVHFTHAKSCYVRVHFLLTTGFKWKKTFYQNVSCSPYEHVISAMPCHAMPCHAMPCHAMPCHTMPCHAMPCPCHTNIYIYIYVYIYIYIYIYKLKEKHLKNCMSISAENSVLNVWWRMELRILMFMLRCEGYV